jgi:hypothetical protein
MAAVKTWKTVSWQGQQGSNLRPAVLETFYYENSQKATTHYNK